MTQTFRRIPGQRATARRPGIVYGVPILDPATREIRTDYVGKTRQMLLSRERQHRDTQPFSDLIVGDAFIIEQGVWTEDELDVREVFHIKRLRPRLNHDDNLDNPDRIPIWRQRLDRDARDLARGVAPRLWPAARGNPASPDRWREVLGSPWTWWLSGWLATTVVLLVAVSWLADETDQDLTLRTRGWMAAVLATVVVARLWWLYGRRSRRRRRR